MEGDFPCLPKALRIFLIHSLSDSLGSASRRRLIAKGWTEWDSNPGGGGPGSSGLYAAVWAAGELGAPDSPAHLSHRASPVHPAGSAAPATEAPGSVTRCPGNSGGSRLGPRARALRCLPAGPVPAPRFLGGPVLPGSARALGYSAPPAPHSYFFSNQFNPTRLLLVCSEEGCGGGG